MRSILLFVMVLSIRAVAQPFQIGSVTTSFFDAQRSRNVDCEVHYPATSPGNNTPFETGSFPVLVVGHGFVMTVNAYDYLVQHFTPLGFIVVLPTTEGGFAPDHADFGADLAFLSEALRAAGNDTQSAFFGHVQPLTALMGHSMGGGAAFLGASGNTDVQALVTMAPAETNPSAIAAAADVQVPTLVLAASEDCVTPIADHAQPIYDGLVVPCRAFINITGGGHCYFGDSNFNCTFGEFTCGPNLTVSRAQQQDVVTDMATLWLQQHLFGDLAAEQAFTDSLTSSARFTSTTACLSTGVAAEQPAYQWNVRADEAGLVIMGLPRSSTVRLFDAVGRTLHVSVATNDRMLIRSDAQGLLFVGVSEGGRWTTQPVPLVR